MVRNTKCDLDGDTTQTNNNDTDHADETDKIRLDSEIRVLKPQPITKNH